MLDLLEIMRGEVGDVEVLVMLGVVTRDGEDLVVRLTAIQHLEHADRAYVDLAPGERRLVDAHENVERISVLVQRARNEPVIAGIVHRRVQHAIELERTVFLVELVLVSAPARDLDYRGDFLGRTGAWRQVAPRMDHGLVRKKRSR